MQTLNSFKKEVISLNDSLFEDLAIRIFHYQARNNPIYKKYLQYVCPNHSQIDSINKILFLPIDFFKTQAIITGQWSPQNTFLSSGTIGSNRSSNYVQDMSFYHRISIDIFKNNYKIENVAILALLPSYLEQENSSLVEMLKYFISESKNKYSGFYLNDYQKLIDIGTILQKNHTPAILFGVTYALLDLAERFNNDFSNIIIIETGGMKGRREELCKEEVHHILSSRLNVKHIQSEYGMTELFSQAYAKQDGIFESPKSMRILIRNINDPFSYVCNGKSGGVNIIDLANIHSCCFIETKDIGVKYDYKKFKIIGRFDNSDIRGCNLLVS